MANRRPLALVSGRTKELPDADGLLVGDATLDASSLSAPRTLVLPDKDGTLATMADIAVANYLTDAPSDGTTYGRKDGAWIATGGGGGLSDAPSDGKYYARRNAAWEQVGQPGVVTVTANTTLNSSHLNKVVEVTVAGPITITIPSGLGAQGDIITIAHSNVTGNVTVQGGGGVNIWRYGSVSGQMIAKIGMMSFYRCAASNTWLAA